MAFWFIPVKFFSIRLSLFCVCLFVCLFACSLFSLHFESKKPSTEKEREETWSCCRCSCSIWSIVRSRSFDGLTKSVYTYDYTHTNGLNVQFRNNLILSFTFTFTHIVFHSLLIFISVYLFIFCFGLGMELVLVFYGNILGCFSDRKGSMPGQTNDRKEKKEPSVVYVSVAHISFF